MRCTKLKIKFEFQYDTESPFGMDIKWENPSVEQIQKVKDFLVRQFDEEIVRVSS